MKYKNGMILVFCFATSASAMDSLLDLSVFDPMDSSVSPFFEGGVVNDTLAIVSGGVASVKNQLETHNKNIIDGVVPNFGSTFTVKEQTEGVSKLKSIFESIKKNVTSLFSSQPAAVLEQGKVDTPNQEEAKVEEKSLLTQISENPGTTAALTAGTVVAFYGSYKLIKYFDQKKAKKIALAKRLKAQRMQASVIFE